MKSVIELAIKYARQFRREIANRRYELSDSGVVLLDSRLVFGGGFVHSVNGGPDVYDPNIVPKEALLYLLGVGLHGDAQLATWYVAPFSGNVTPASTITAATFDSVATEFTNYAEAARPEWVEAAPDATGVTVDNYASRAVFTIGAGGGTIYGAGLLSASAKEAITGKIAAASRFASSRAVLENDVLSIGYRLAATST